MTKQMGFIVQSCEFLLVSIDSEGSYAAHQELHISAVRRIGQIDPGSNMAKRGHIKLSGEAMMLNFPCPVLVALTYQEHKKNPEGDLNSSRVI